MARRLILAPHHDDAEFGLGAVIQQWLAAGDQVRVVVFAHGSYKRPDGTKVEGRIREAESAAALKHLGVQSYYFGAWFPENGAMERPYGSLVSGVEQVVRDFEATDVYVCLPSFNQDHDRLYAAALTAFRPGAQTASLFAYEYPGNAWGPKPAPMFGRRYHPVTKVEVDRKIAALHLHESQFKGRAGGVNPAAAEILAVSRGLEIGEQYAECVYVLKEIVR